jgi:aryl-alcohol dehydrogenase-like predicted oxidoreductase
MKHRNFGSDSLRVSEIGLGTWQLGAEWGNVADDTAQQILQAAVDNGINFFDTADIYGQGRSERRIGRFLQASQANVTVATKLGRASDPGWPDNFGADVIRRHTEASLARLGVDSLDLTQFHCIDPHELKKGDVFDAVRRLQEEGLIRRFGASVESIEDARVCLKQEGLASLQVIFNIFRQEPAKDLFAEAAEKGVAIIVRVPLASGLLSGRFDRRTRFAADDHRNFNADGQRFNVGETFAGVPFAKGLELVEEIRPLVPAGMTMAQFALRWILDHAGVTVVIPGATSPDQAAANAAASELAPLGETLHRNLRDLYETTIRPHVRGPV